MSHFFCLYLWGCHLFLKPVVVSPRCGHARSCHVIIHWSWLLISGGPKRNFIRREKEALKWSFICPHVSCAWVVLRGYGRFCHIPSNAAWQKGAGEDGMGTSTALSSCKLVQKSSGVGEEAQNSTEVVFVTSHLLFGFIRVWIDLCRKRHIFELRKTGPDWYFGKAFLPPTELKRQDFTSKERCQ